MYLKLPQNRLQQTYWQICPKKSGREKRNDLLLGGLTHQKQVQIVVPIQVAKAVEKRLRKVKDASAITIKRSPNLSCMILISIIVLQNVYPS